MHGPCTGPFHRGQNASPLQMILRCDGASQKLAKDILDSFPIMEQHLAERGVSDTVHVICVQRGLGLFYKKFGKGLDLRADLPFWPHAPYFVQDNQGKLRI